MRDTLILCTAKKVLQRTIFVRKMIIKSMQLILFTEKCLCIQLAGMHHLWCFCAGAITLDQQETVISRYVHSDLCIDLWNGTGTYAEDIVY